MCPSAVGRSGGLLVCGSKGSMVGWLSPNVSHDNNNNNTQDVLESLRLCWNNVPVRWRLLMLGAEVALEDGLLYLLLYLLLVLACVYVLLCCFPSAIILSLRKKRRNVKPLDVVLHA